MYEEAAALINHATRCVGFTGAGISVESGIPPFRGENGLWNKYDPETFDIGFFNAYPESSWKAIRTIFYDLFGRVEPNTAHYVLAEMEQAGMIKAVITQNVDNLHYDAGSQVVHEFHGSLKKLICLKCKKKYPIQAVDLKKLPPPCGHCSGILKPDVIFFGEAIPEPARSLSFAEADKADCFILIGTTGTVAPANMIPHMAKRNGATIIEINTHPSEYTDEITDVYIQAGAVEAMEKLMEEIERSC
ncbi:MAG: NAD-dependent protein deacylase [Desulfobacteraceae bacterium]|nr:MAG: NAD-dependent protein deacylase [Desulfobacteraceae bacterium]